MKSEAAAAFSKLQLPQSLAHVILPEFRNTNAPYGGGEPYLQPVMERYLERLTSRMAEPGTRGRIFVDAIERWHYRA